MKIKEKKERVKKPKNHKRERIKVKKYFENNLKPGDFIVFPSGQRYRILPSGIAFPACKTSNCKKQAQGVYLYFLQANFISNKAWKICISSAEAALKSLLHRKKRNSKLVKQNIGGSEKKWQRKIEPIKNCERN